MHVARRLYLYAMSGIALSIVGAGLVIVARILLRNVIPPQDFGFGIDEGAGSQDLSQALALLAVGVPVWAVHWRLVGRDLGASNPERDVERGSAIRAAYLVLVLVITLVIWVPSVTTVAVWAITGLLDARPEFSISDPLASSTLAIVAFAIWLLHAIALRGDLRTGVARGAAAWLPRLYLYGIGVVALFVALQAVEGIVTLLVLSTPSFANDDEFRTTLLVSGAVAVVTWAVVAAGHWSYANRLARGDAGRAAEERQSRTRVGAFVVVIVVAATAALQSVAAVINALIAPAIVPDFSPDFATPGLAAPVVSAVLYAATWAVAARAIRREPAAADPIRRLHQARLTSHGIAATMLLLGGVGAAWLAGYVIDVALNGSRTDDFGSSGYELPRWIATTVVALPAWFVFWRLVMARRRRDPQGEATSAIRQSFLYLTVGIALVAAMVPAMLILNAFLAGVLNPGFGSSLTYLSTPLGVLLTASVAFAYHWLQLRGDGEVGPRAVAPPTEPTEPTGDGGAAPPPPGEEPAVTAPPAVVAESRMAVVLDTIAMTLHVPAGSDPKPAIAAMHAALPPGMELAAREA